MSSGIESVHFENYAVLGSFDLPRASPINLVIGENGTGKTFFLKALYSAVRSWAEALRNTYYLSTNEVLYEMLHRTFQVFRLGELVTFGSQEPLDFQMKLDGQSVSYSFSARAAYKASSVRFPRLDREITSVFIPAKEVFTHYYDILRAKGRHGSPSIDDTCYDLVTALRPLQQHEEYGTAFSGSRAYIWEFIRGQVEVDGINGGWRFRDPENNKISIGAVSDGVKKLCVFDYLFANGCVDDRSIIFIDDIETTLHPDAVCRLLDMINDLAAKTEIQFFISTHSAVVIRKLALMANKHPGLVTCISLSRDKEPVICDLHDGMPDNSIIDNSIRLYEQEIEAGL